MTAQLNPSNLISFLTSAMRARLPVLITGAPGIGKSDIISQVGKILDADIILSHPAVSDPTDAKGFPWPLADKGEATFLPFGELARALKATKLTIWFLDDLGQATPAVQASFMQLILARRVNGHVLPDCVVFVAATNRRTDRAGVAGILEPVKSRFASIVELIPSLDDWCNWALNAGVQPELVAFIRFRPELLSAFQPSADLVNSPCPRTWHHVSKLMTLGLPSELQLPVFAGAVGDGAATELVSFLRMVAELPNIDAILLDPKNAPLPTAPATLYAVVTALATKSNVKTFGRIAEYAQRLIDVQRGEFAALLIRDCVRKDGAVCGTREFIKLASGDLGKLIGAAK